MLLDKQVKKVNVQEITVTKTHEFLVLSYICHNHLYSFIISCHIYGDKSFLLPFIEPIMIFLYMKNGLGAT